MNATTTLHRPRWLTAAVVAGASALALAACSSSGSKSTAVSTGGASGQSSSSPGTSFSTADVTGLGTVVVDGQGRTVYLLTSGGHTNVPCTDSSGCTKFWPDLPLPNGVSAAKAGSGVQASLLGTMKESDGQTYPTYNGWLMYEFKGDSGPGQGHGEGIHSFGGTWYAISPSGDPVMMSAQAPTTTAGKSGGYSYNY